MKLLLCLFAVFLCCSAGPLVVLTSQNQGIFCEQYYRVQQGDTTASIAAKYNISPYQLAIGNYLHKIDYDNLQVGQNLCVYSYGALY